VFRVAADFSGDEVMCPSCQETLRLPKKPGDTPPFSAPLQATPPAPAPRTDETPAHVAADEPAWRKLVATPGGRKKLALALGLPLLLVAVVLMFLPANEPPGAETSSTPQAANPESPESPGTAAPLPETDAPQIADLTPEVHENVPAPEAPPPAVPGVTDPALLADVSDDPEAGDPVVQVPAPPIDPEHGLVDAIPATSPVAQPPVETPATPATPATPGEPDDSAVTVHTVVSGDTLGKISDSYGVSVDVIQQANDLRNDTVQVGQRLRIPGATPPAPAQPPVEETTSPPAARHHTVVRGDTLSRIARKYAVDPKAIMRANGMKNDVVRLGAKLVIPPADP
jgi:LysM repeat protein